MSCISKNTFANFNCFEYSKDSRETFTSKLICNWSILDIFIGIFLKTNKKMNFSQKGFFPFNSSKKLPKLEKHSRVWQALAACHILAGTRKHTCSSSSFSGKIIHLILLKRRVIETLSHVILAADLPLKLFIVIFKSTFGK